MKPFILIFVGDVVALLLNLIFVTIFVCRPMKPFCLLAYETFSLIFVDVVALLLNLIFVTIFHIPSFMGFIILYQQQSCFVDNFRFQGKFDILLPIIFAF